MVAGNEEEDIADSLMIDLSVLLHTDDIIA